MVCRVASFRVSLCVVEFLLEINDLKIIWNDFDDTDAQRQSGVRQAGSNIEPDRSGEPPIGQATAVAAAQFLTGTLGGNQQQPQQVKVEL